MINLNLENLKEKALTNGLCYMSGVSTRRIDEIKIDGEAMENVFYCDIMNNFALLYQRDEKGNPIIVNGGISLVAVFGKISFTQLFQVVV